MKRFLPAFAALAVLIAGVADANATVHRIVLDGPVDPIHAEYVVRALDEAERQGSDLVLLELDTPGGMVTSMEAIIRRMLASRVPVAAFVHPAGGRAASAGFFLLLTADVAAMAPGTRTGAAHPVMSIGGFLPLPDGGGGGEMPDLPPKKDGEAGGAEAPAKKSGDPVMMQKVMSDVQGYLRAIAERRGRDPKAAELAVTESRTWTEQEALAARLIDVVASSETDLVTQLEGREVRLVDGTTKVLSVRNSPIVTIEKTFRERALAFLTDPSLAFLLLLVGALLVYIEVTHAGLVVPGVVGGICLLLAVTGFSFLPVTATGVLLLLAAVGLFVAEFLVQASGILGIAGAVCLALGGIMLVDVPEAAEIRVDPWLAVSAAAAFGGIIVFLTTLALRALRRPSATGSGSVVNEYGVALTDLAPRGTVQIGGEYWDAVSSAPVSKGERVRTTGIDGLTLSVEPAAVPPEES